MNDPKKPETFAPPLETEVFPPTIRKNPEPEKEAPNELDAIREAASKPGPDTGLMSLSVANQKALELRKGLGRNVLNGIECPACKSELVDECPAEVIGSSPPMLRVGCSKAECTYRGTRIL